MNTNTLILGKYATVDTLALLAAKAATRLEDNTYIITSAEDPDLDSPAIAKHNRHMMGDVCNLLWEAVRFRNDTPLEIASSKGYLHPMVLGNLDADICIFCDEPAYASFHFDNDGAFIESGELPGNIAFRLYYAKTGDFVKAAEKIILAGKTTDGLYTLSTVVNQSILDGKKIHVAILPEIE